jgi:hypothetical protein
MSLRYKLNSFALATVLLLVEFHASAQEKYWIQTDSLFKYVQPSASLQFWTTYSMGEQAQLTDNGPLESVQDRLSFMARRARIGFKGKPYKKLSYAVSIQYDNLGKDKLSAVRGGTNTGDLGILDAYITLRLTNNDLASLTLGYFHPQLSRECITGDLLVNSFDKSPSQTYIRQHIVGKNYGRATGINVGGMKQKDVFTVGYNVGLFNNNTTANDQSNLPETTGKYWSPLVVERITFSFGDPDIKTYSINYDANNYFNKRNGITIGVNSSQQGKTELFKINKASGFDVLANFAHFNFDGEWLWLERTVEGQSFTAQTGHVRAGYNVILKQKFFLEPCLMMMFFDGNNGGRIYGQDRMYDAGINWYLNKKNCKLSLHYIIQEGKGNNGYTDGVTFKKGNFIGGGLVLII